MKRVGLTDAGRKVPQVLNEARLSALQELMSSLVDEEAEALQHALELILQAPRRHRRLPTINQ